MFLSAQDLSDSGAHGAAASAGTDGLLRLSEQGSGGWLVAIEDTCQNWLRWDGSLHYAILPDGSYGMQDYPYLTYNDLYTLQAYLRSSGRGENAAIALLMERKLASMQALGITGYYE